MWYEMEMYFTQMNAKKLEKMAKVKENIRLKAKGLKSIAWIPITGKSDLLMFVGVDWVKDPAPSINIKDLKPRLQSLKL